MNPTDKPVVVELGNKRYTAYFNLNTFARFEEISGKHFLEFLASMQEALETLDTNKLAAGTLSGKEGMEFMRRISIRDLRAFLHAAIHTYDSRGEPQWLLSAGQLGQMITASNMPAMVTLVMRGSAQNSPTPEEIKGDTRPSPAPATVPLPSTETDGGQLFGPSDEDALDSLTRTSGS